MLVSSDTPTTLCLLLGCRRRHRDTTTTLCLLLGCRCRHHDTSTTLCLLLGCRRRHSGPIVDVVVATTAGATERARTTHRNAGR
jgi:hypothetical protein